jgi:hypothetical protein
MNHSTFGMRITFSRIVALSMMVCLLFVATSYSHILISITLNYASINVCIFMDGSTSTSTMSSSLASIYITCVNIDCYSTTSFSSNSSMNTISTYVVLGHVCEFAHQCFLLLCKNSTTDVLV